MLSSGFLARKSLQPNKRSARFSFGGGCHPDNSGKSPGQRNCHTPFVGWLQSARRTAKRTCGRSARNRETQMERDKALDMALGQIEKQFGKGSIMRLGENATMDIEVVSTGALSLDVALGVGGLPRGRVVEIFGPESSGKSTLATTVVAEAQRNGGKCAYIDAEHAMD